MADAGLFIGWGQVVRGREDRALDVFNETVEFYGQLQSDGRIESFEVCLLEPHGGELAGLRAAARERGADRRRPPRRGLRAVMTKASLIVDDLGMIGAALGEGLARAMSIYQEEIAVVA